MASENTPADGDSVATLAGRLSEMSHRTSLTALDALLGAAGGEGDRTEAARLAKALADRLARSTAEIQDSLAIR